MRVSEYKKYALTHCRSCFSNELVNILSLGDQYLSDFTKSKKKPQKFPLQLILCKRCNLLQLRHTVSQSLLYTERYGYRSGINKTMRNELKEVVRKSMKKILVLETNKKTIVVDIGANDGTLLSNYPSSLTRVAIEPIKKFAERAKKHADVVINNFFDFKLYEDKMNTKKAKIITAISCFYDMEQPNDFLSGVKQMLHKDGIFVIQQNYLVGMLKQNAFDNIVHEHLEYYSLLSLENLLRRHDMEVFDVELSDINGGSFRTFISHVGEKRISRRVTALRTLEKKLMLHKKKIYVEFAQRVKKNKKNLGKLVTNLIKENKTVYIYGASTRGNTLLQYFKFDNKQIKAAVERNSEKWGKVISSVGIPIISEEQAREEKPDYMLVLPWFFKEEFLKREKSYLDAGGHFIFPLPTLEVI